MSNPLADALNSIKNTLTGSDAGTDAAADTTTFTSAGVDVTPATSAGGASSTMVSILPGPADEGDAALSAGSVVMTVLTLGSSLWANNFKPLCGTRCSTVKNKNFCR